MIHENKSDMILLNQIASKIVNGLGNWTAEELQYQRNHPDKVEQALHGFRQKSMILDKILVLHNNANYMQVKRFANDLGIDKPITMSYTEAAAIAVTVNVTERQLDGKETTMVILTVVEDVLDMTAVTIGDGVYEVLCSNCVS